MTCAAAGRVRAPRPPSSALTARALRPTPRAGGEKTLRLRGWRSQRTHDVPLFTGALTPALRQAGPAAVGPLTRCFLRRRESMPKGAEPTFTNCRRVAEAEPTARTWRHKFFPEYKANRRAPRPEQPGARPAHASPPAPAALRLTRRTRRLLCPLTAPVAQSRTTPFPQEITDAFPWCASSVDRPRRLSARRSCAPTADSRQLSTIPRFAAEGLPRPPSTRTSWQDSGVLGVPGHPRGAAPGRRGGRHHRQHCADGGGGARAAGAEAWR